MKLTSLTAILLLSALGAAADVVMVTGTVYDVGKGSWSADPGVDNKTDTQLCWAATASNLIQHWQDAYGAAEGAPNGTVAGHTMPGGTQYLEVYDLFCENFKDMGGTMRLAVDWYFNGDVAPLFVSYLAEGAIKPGYYRDLGFSSDGSTGISSLETLKDKLDISLQKAGYGVFLGIKPVTGGSGHAITCWGYETDAGGDLCALYITDSDDEKFGAQRIGVAEKDGEIVFSSAYENSYYDNYKLAGVYYMTCSDNAYNKAKASNALTSLPAEGVIDQSADMSGQQLASGSALTLEAGAVLAASGQTGTSLTLGGEVPEGEVSAKGDGLTVKAGAMVSLGQAAVSVSGFAGNGMSIGSEAHIAQGSVSVQNNGGAGIAVQGTADDPMAYMCLSGNSSVAVSHNQKGGLRVGNVAVVLGNGKYCHESDQLDITGNGSVLIGHNTAEQGGGAFVHGTLNLTGNAKLDIAGNTAEQGAAIYATSQAVAADSSGGKYYIADAKVNMTGNGEVNITGNTATGSDIVYFHGKQMSISGNTAVTFSGNSVQGDPSTSAVLHNAGQDFAVPGGTVQMSAASVMEIVGNGSVTFSGNSAKYDIYNEGDLYICAYEGQSVTFQHGIANSGTGTAEIGMDYSGNISEGGTYTLTDGNVSMTMNAQATLSENGGILLTEGSFAITNASIDGSLKVDLGSYLATNTLTMTHVELDGGSSLAVTLDLQSAYPVSMALDGEPGDSSLTHTTVIRLGDYLSINGTDLDNVGVTFTLDGTLAEGQLLAVDTTGITGLSLAPTVTATGYTLTASENGILSYKQTEYVPEPSTATLSLLALAALAARRRRH